MRPDGTMCVQKVGFGDVGWPHGEPIPPICQGEVTCDCVGDLVGVDGFTLCAAEETTVTCECPNF